LAAVQRDADRYDEALDTVNEALAMHRRDGARRDEVDTLLAIATIRCAMRQHGKAIDHHGQALAVAREFGRRGAEVEALIGLAAAHRQLGQTDRAFGYADQAIRLWRRPGPFDVMAPVAVGDRGSGGGLPKSREELQGVPAIRRGSGWAQRPKDNNRTRQRQLVRAVSAEPEYT
jgi:tetratricopeptide (TPR) repeat protein